MKRHLKLIVLGIMGQSPFAGVAWQALHYLEGFRRLGVDVHYVEDTGVWAYDPEQNTVTDDCTYAVNYIGKLMAWCGLPDRWAFRGATKKRSMFGPSASRFAELFQEGDVLVNLTGSTALRDEHLRVPIRIYLETDPVLPQIEAAKGNISYIDMLSAHTHRFTYGENFGAPDCDVPLGDFRYLPTRQPIVLDWWTAANPAINGASTPMANACFSTIANWRQSGKDVEWNGEIYTWSKHHAFLKFLDLPRCTEQPLELALALRGYRQGEGAWVPSFDEDAEAVRDLTAHGWRVVDAMSLSKEIFSYRDYITGSLGEFTVAKDQYARLRSGWFSDRSASYLAAGKPVVTQETGFSKFIPVGEGLFAFNSFEEAVAAILEISADYAHHCRAARDLAAEHFSAEGVLTKLLEDAGLA
jgi:hypothetical protein